MRVAVYARVSTSQDQSCQMQLRDLQAYCAARSYLDVTEFVDTGVSGSKDSRPSLNQMMDCVRKRKIDAVIVWRFDRFARSTKHLLSALEEFRALGVQFISYNENIDTASPLGQAIFTILGAVAQLERDIVRERIFGGIRNARAKGIILGRPKRVVDRERIVAMRAEGLSFREISKRLGVSAAVVRERFKQRAEIMVGNDQENVDI